MRERYDLAFSMGFGCGCSNALRRSGLQYASFPMDWVGVTGVARGAEMIAGDFAGWLDKDAMELIDVRRDDENYQRAYRHRKTGFVFTHDFPYEVGFDEAFETARRKYDRRIARLTGMIRASRRVLAVYVEHPIHGRAPDADLVRARDLLRARFPGVTIDLLYFHHRDAAAGDSAAVAEGVTAVACAYRRIDYGLVSHGIETDGICRYLSEHVEVADYRTEEERHRFAARGRARSDDRFGRGLSRWIARLQYRIYRKLGGDLKRKNIIPRARPFWF